jgi:hypothetical protein
MATAATTANELPRRADFTVFQRAQEARLPQVEFWNMGLREVAELCKRDYAARPDRDCNAVRDQLLLIAIEWDLARDRLDQQSDTCLRAIADFLR